MKSKLTLEKRKKRRKEYLDEYAKKYSIKNKLKISNYKKEYYKKNKVYIDDRNKNWNLNNKDKIKKYLNKYYLNEDNMQKRRDTSNKWHNSKNNKKYRYKKRIWENNKRKEDLQFRIKKNLRLRIIQAFKKYSTTGKIRKSKEYDINYEKIIIKLMKELPKDFDKEEYHIDHIIPCCSFDLTNLEEVKKCFAPENHQWLLAKDNLTKISEDLKMRLDRKE